VLSSGHVLDNRYRLDERIATGGMGDVWRGTDVVLGRVIAVKVLRTAMLTDPEFAARFYGEARMMAAFRHPGVVEVYDYASAGDAEGEEDQVAYLVMAFVDGEPLSTRLKEQGSVPIGETMSIVAQAADALHAAHQNGTVHRDVKPGNLMIKPNGTVILVDFGVARSAAVTSVTGLNAIVGTALYMAPEQVAKGNVSPATDIYALGAVAYHCIAGRPPFDGDNALQVALRHLEDDPEPLPEDVPPAVRALITRAMAKDPAERFASAAEFADAAMAAAGPMDWRSLTGTQMTAPLSPAAPTRAVPMPRGMPPTGGPGSPYATGTGTRTAVGAPGIGVRPPGGPGGPLGPGPGRGTIGGGARRGTPRSQLALGAAVLVLFLVAIGLAVAIKLSGGDEQKQVTPGPQASTAATPEDSPTPTEDPSTEAPPTRTATKPNGGGHTRTTAPASASASASSKPPTSKPTTTPPTTTPPTTEPTTDPPTDPTTDPTEDTDPGTGGGGGGGGGGNVNNLADAND
jgi:serine/threonine-protein kinase